MAVDSRSSHKNGCRNSSVERMLIILTLTAIALNPVMVCILFSQSTRHRLATHDQCPTPREQEYCYTCQPDQVSVMKDLRSVRTKNESGRQLCCTTNTQYLRQMVKKTLQTRFTRDWTAEMILRRLQGHLRHSYSDHGNQKKTAAHIVKQGNVNYNGSPVPTLMWNIRASRSFLSGGVEYHNGSLKVLQGGYYYVYSQILYTRNKMEELPYGRICHYLYRYNERYKDSGKQKLSANLQSTCKVRRGEFSYASSYIGAVFYLEANDEVTTLSSLPGNIHTSQQATYSGLYMV